MTADIGDHEETSQVDNNDAGANTIDIATEWSLLGEVGSS